MTVSRVLGVGALLLALLVVGWLLFRSQAGHEYTLIFQNSGQLVRGGQVRIAGRPVGSVDGISLTEDNRAAIKVTVHEPYAPLTHGTTATIRAASMSGQANRYVALSLGPNNAEPYEDGATIEDDRTTTIVDLDELFASLDPKTRKGLQNIIRGSSIQYGDDGEKANEALKQFNPLVKSFTRLSAELNRDQQTFADALVNTAKLSTLLAERSDDLAGSVSNAGEMFSAIAEENVALDETLRELPGALRSGNTTLVELRAALDDLDKLTAATKPVAPELAPFFRKLRPLVKDAQPTVKDLRLLISRPGPANDLTDLLKLQPRLTQVSGPALSNTTTSLRKSMPVFTFLRPYAPDMIGWFRDFGQTTANYDANGHFARVSPVVDAFAFEQTGAGTGTMTAREPSDRQNALEKGKARRCPGSAAAPPADGSAPYTPAGSDCDPTAVVPGP